MNTSILIPNWEASGYVNLVDLDFGTYVSEPIVELNGQCSELTCDVLNGQFTELAYPLMSPLTCDVLSGQCCDLVDAPKVETKLTPDELADVRASVQRACSKMERRTCYGSPVRHGSPTITTKSGKVVPVSPHAVTPHGDAPKANCINNPKVASAIGEAEAIAPTQLNIFQAPEYTVQVANCKTELLDSSDFEEVISITRKYNATDKQIVLDAKASMNKRELAYIEGLKKAYTIIKDSEAVKSPQVTTPVVTHNQMMSAIRRMNGGRIPNIPALNKLVNGYIARNNAVIKSVSKFISPEILDMAERAYAQLTA